MDQIVYRTNSPKEKTTEESYPIIIMIAIFVLVIIILSIIFAFVLIYFRRSIYLLDFFSLSLNIFNSISQVQRNIKPVNLYQKSKVSESKTNAKTLAKVDLETGLKARKESEVSSLMTIDSNTGQKVIKKLSVKEIFKIERVDKRFQFCVKEVLKQQKVIRCDLFF
jgi:hypothetical protein